MRLCGCVCASTSRVTPRRGHRDPHQGTLPSALRRRQSHFCHLVAFARVAWVCIGEFHVAGSHGENTLSQIERKISDLLEKRSPRLAADNISSCAGRMNPMERRSELQVRTRGLPGDVSLPAPDPSYSSLVWTRVSR